MDRSWIVEQTGWRQEEIEFLGSKFTIGNGYFGYRGTLEEYGPAQLTACTLSELYDDSGSGWREILNVHNPLWILGDWNGTPLSVLETQPESHRQWLALDEGLHGRETVFRGPEGSVTLSCQRFASAADVHLLCARYTLTADRNTAVTVAVGIDQNLWELSGPHYQQAEFARRNGCLSMDAVTNEMQYRVSVAQALLPEGEWSEEAGTDHQRVFRFRLRAGIPTGLTIFAAICKSTDCSSPSEEAPRLARKAMERGWDGLLADHRQVWRKRWETFDVAIGGDPEAQLALRHSIFLLTCAAPFHTGGIAIPARGLSGQVYKGGMFWDTELYFLPMFLHCAPQAARNLVSYRIRNLSGALAKAKEEGYAGAFYPWESQETGQEGCTYYNLTDIFTGRPVRTYFRDKQIHISAAAAHGILTYIRSTGDLSLLAEGGAETLLECAEFFWSYAYYKVDKARFELLDVTGPDEYHERVNNNAYTNAMARETALGALEALELLEKTFPDAYQALARKDPQLEEKREHARRLSRELYVPGPRQEDLVIPQYDNFFRMEDCTLEQLRQRIINPNEYLGSPTGLTVNTQIAKQADVVLLLCVLGSQYSDQVKQANWAYYEPRCEHGSSLSTCVYALLAAQIGKTDWAYRFFLRAAQLDLLGGYKLYLGPLYIGGTHPAANGGSWMVAVQGFGGLSLQGDYASIEPHLPEQWTSLAFSFYAAGLRFTAQLTHHQIKLTADQGNSRPYPFRHGGQEQLCFPGETIVWEDNHDEHPHSTDRL